MSLCFLPPDRSLALQSHSLAAFSMAKSHGAELNFGLLTASMKWEINKGWKVQGFQIKKDKHSGGIHLKNLMLQTTNTFYTYITQLISHRRSQTTTTFTITDESVWIPNYVLSRNHTFEWRREITILVSTRYKLLKHSDQMTTRVLHIHRYVAKKTLYT